MENNPRKPIDAMNSYLRANRPSDYIEFDRLVRLTLAWFDSHKIKDTPSFLDQRGNEYTSFTGYLTSQLGYPPELTPDFVANMKEFSAKTR
jgi:hypothetical protein